MPHDFTVADFEEPTHEFTLEDFADESTPELAGPPIPNLPVANAGDYSVAPVGPKPTGRPETPIPNVFELGPVGGEIVVPSGAQSEYPGIAIPASAAAQPVAGFLNYLRTPQGAGEMGLAATPLAPLVQAKWAYDMLKSAKQAAFEDLPEATRGLLGDLMTKIRAPGSPTQAREHFQDFANSIVNLGVMGIGGIGAGTHAIKGAVNPLAGVRATTGTTPPEPSAPSRERIATPEELQAAAQQFVIPEASKVAESPSSKSTITDDLETQYSNAVSKGDERTAQSILDTIESDLGLAPKVEVRKIDYQGEPHWTVFVDGVERTSEFENLPTKDKAGAESVSQVAEREYSIAPGQKDASGKLIPLKELFSEEPKTTPVTAATERTTDASKNITPTEVHGDVRTFPIEGEQAVPTKEGSAGVLETKPEQAAESPVLLDLGEGFNAEIDPTGGTIVYRNAKGDRVGGLDAGIDQNGDIIVDVHSIQKEARGKGFGGKAVQKLSELTGRKIISDESPSVDAQSMWERIGAKREKVSLGDPADPEISTRYVLRPKEAQPSTALKKGETDPNTGARFDGDVARTSGMQFTALTEDGKESTTFGVPRNATPEQTRAKYNEVRQTYIDEGRPDVPRPLPEAPKTEAPPDEGRGIGGGIQRAIERNREGGFVNMQPAIEFGTKVFEKIKDRAAWAVEMVKQFGEWVKGHLDDLWLRVRNEHPEQIANDIGFEFKRNDAPAINMEGMPPEMVEQFKAQFKPQWEFTDKRKGSPTEGITFYTPEGTTRADVVKRLREKQGEVTGKTQTLWSSSEPQQGKANYFSDLKSDADTYSLGRESKQHQVTIQNPFDPSTSKDAELLALYDKYGGIQEAPRNARFIKALKAKGYDSVIGGETGYGGESNWVITYDKQKATPEIQERHAGIPIPGAAALTEGVRKLGSTIAEAIGELTADLKTKEGRNSISRRLSLEAAPRTMAASEASGNALVRYAASQHAAPLVAEAMALDVLGPRAGDKFFRDRLGAVLVEDRLRAIRAGFRAEAAKAATPAERARLNSQANKVTTLVGEGKPFGTNTDFLNAIKETDIAEAIDKHKKSIQVEAQKFHEETGGQVAGPGMHTGAFVNLEALGEESPINFGQGGRGDITRPLKRKSVFGREAKGTGKKYELDYNRLAERMIRGNFEEFTKREMYKQLEADGLAKVLPANEPNPNIGGKPSEKIPIQRRVIVTADGKTIPQYENLWVDRKVAGEVTQALNLSGRVSHAALYSIGKALNALQLAGPVDAISHVANIFTSIAGKQGGQNRLIDIARKLPGVNIVDATVRLGMKAREVIARDPEIVKEMSELAKIGASRPEHLEAGFNSRIIKTLDKAARLIRNDMYDNLVQRGVIKEATEAGRREFINQIGQYNPRLQGVFQRFFKEIGASPFVVAGRTFNRAGIRAVTLDPGFKAANKAEALKSRGVEAFGLLATLVAVPTFINMLTTGKPNGRPGVLVGQIDTGENDKKGNPIVVDPAQWTGLRRGMRITGVNAVLNGLRANKPMGEIEHQAMQDIIGGAVGPWAGPVVQGEEVFRTGKTPSGFTESENPKSYWENFKAAVKGVNPLAHRFFTKNEDDFLGKSANVIKGFAAPFGLKTAQKLTAHNETMNRANSWMEKSKDPEIQAALKRKETTDLPESQYKPLRLALDVGDKEKATKAINEVLSTFPKDEMQKHIKLMLREFDPFTMFKPKEGEGFPSPRSKVFATPSRKMEESFKQSLDADGKKAYKQAIDEKVRAYRLLHEVLYNTPENPPLFEEYQKLNP